MIVLWIHRGQGTQTELGDLRLHPRGESGDGKRPSSLFWAVTTELPGRGGE